MSDWYKDEDGNLVGNIELPMAVGTVGGASKVHPAARANLALLGVESATELGNIMAARASTKSRCHESTCNRRESNKDT